jgi:hypothetical protein
MRGRKARGRCRSLVAPGGIAEHAPRHARHHSVCRLATANAGPHYRAGSATPENIAAVAEFFRVNPFARFGVFGIRFRFVGFKHIKNRFRLAFIAAAFL